MFKKLLFIFITLSLTHASVSESKELVDRLEAVVNKKAIYKSDVSKFRALMPLRAKIDPLFASSPISKKTTLSDDDIIQFLINEELIGQKYPVTDAEVEQEITGIQASLKIDREGLKSAIRNEGFKFEDYQNLMRLSIAKRQLLDREIRSKAAVSEDDLKNEYNKSQFGTSAFRGSFHLFIFKTAKKSFKSPALAKEATQKALSSIQKGESFETVAKASSDDESASTGGDLGFLSYSDLSPVLQKEVKKLGVGKLSGIIDEGQSYYLLKVTEVKADEDSNFGKEKEPLRARLMEEEFQHQISLWIDRQRATNYIRRNKLKAAT